MERPLFLVGWGWGLGKILHCKTTTTKKDMWKGSDGEKQSRNCFLLTRCSNKKKQYCTTYRPPKKVTHNLEEKNSWPVMKKGGPTLIVYGEGFS